jgi:peroxiredoxin
MTRFAILLTLVLLAGCSGGDKPPLGNGDPAPAFQLRDLGERSVSLTALKGKVVAVRFWADWCRFCEGEMRALQPVYERLHGEGLELLAVNMGQSRATAAEFSNRLGLGYPVLLDSDSAVTERYGVIVLPTTFLVDRRGRVRGKILGESDAPTFEQLVRPLLSEEP